VWSRRSDLDTPPPTPDRLHFFNTSLVAMEAVEHTSAFRVPVPAAVVFPLFSPEGEKAWVPGWDYESPLGTTEMAEDFVFLTRSHAHGAAEAVWLVKRHDPTAHMVELYKVEPGEKVGMVRVRCRDLPGGESEVQVRYRYVPLSATGREFVEGFTHAAFETFIGEWETLLSAHFSASDPPTP